MQNGHNRGIGGGSYESCLKSHGELLAFNIKSWTSENVLGNEMRKIIPGQRDNWWKLDKSMWEDIKFQKTIYLEPKEGSEKGGIEAGGDIEAGKRCNQMVKD